VRQTTTVTPGTGPVAAPYRGPWRGGVAPAPYRGPVAATRTTGTVYGFEPRGLLATAGGMTAPVDAGRHLLQSCKGGCASWGNQSGGRRTCAKCCTGYYMKVGDMPWKGPALLLCLVGDCAASTESSEIARRSLVAEAVCQHCLLTHMSHLYCMPAASGACGMHSLE
jgi:hypothetical protein